MGDRPLLITAEKLFETMGLPPGEAHIHRFIGRYEKGFKLVRRYIDDERPRQTDITVVHPDRESLWRSIQDLISMAQK